MNYLHRFIIFLLFSGILVTDSLNAQIYINEIMAKNDNVIADENGDFDDWVELYNAGTTPVNIAGYYFSENLTDPTFWEIPNTDPTATTIPAGGYLLIWADEDTEDGPHHIGFKLSANGQGIYLFAPDGNTLVDELTFPSLSTNTSYGRETDGAINFQTFTAVSPGASNTTGVNSYDAIIVTRINDGNDDAEEPFEQIFMTLSDVGINIVNDWSGDQKVGFRFDELNIPAGAVVTRAYIQFTTSNISISNGPSNLTINGHASGNSTPFEALGQDITTRTPTNAAVNWQPAEWRIEDESEITQQTPDLTEIVQEILDQPDWSESSALTFFMSGTGTRVAYSYEGDPLLAPQLHLEVSIPVTNTSIPVTNLFINEIAPGGTTHTDESGSFEDWVEIYNGGTETVNLGGLFFSDSYSNPTKWQISQPYFLEAGDFVVLFTDNDPEEGGLHADFSLSASGEEIVLAQSINNNIVVIDSVSFSEVPFQTSYGRATDGADEFVIFGEVTPNESNNGSMLGLEKPTIDLANGIYEGTQMVGFSHPDPTVTLRYTLDGKEPESFSTTYSTPFAINNNASVKVAAFKSGHVKSTSAVGSYLFNINSNIPTLYINSDPDNFFDDEIGIYVKGTNGVPGFCRTDPVNWNQVDWERPINLGMFLPDGSEAFNVNAGIRISGGCSRIYGQKSLNVYMRRNMYGDDAIDYPIYKGRENTIYERIKLRNSGQDFLRTMFRDGLIQSLLWDRIDMDLLGYQPTTLYLNGNFWGIYNIRELFNDEHFENVYGVDNDEIDLLKNPGMPWEDVKRGTDTEYKALFDFASNNDLSTPANYQTVANQFDINQLTNYWAYSIYVARNDWPANNIILWKEQKAGKKWRYGAIDHDGSTDNGFGPETAPNYNTLEQVMVNTSTQHPNHSSSTLFFRKLLKNENFRNEFLQRSCSFIELIFSEDRTANITDSLEALIAPHIANQEIRWGTELSIGGDEANWRLWVDKMKDFFVTRPDFHRGFMNEEFNLDGFYQLTLNYNEATNGRVVINSNEMETPYNFTNLYFKNIPVQLKAIAEEGYRFSHWLETGETTEVVNFVAGDNAVMTPIFDQETVGVDEPEQLISYQIFPNPTTGKVNLLASFDQVTEATIAIYDLLGKVIYTKNINHISINEQLDLSANTSGIYLLNIITEKGTITERLVINR